MIFWTYYGFFVRTYLGGRRKRRASSQQGFGCCLVFPSRLAVSDDEERSKGAESFGIPAVKRGTTTAGGGADGASEVSAASTLLRFCGVEGSWGEEL